MNVAQRLTSIYPSPAEDVRRLTQNIHDVVNSAEYGINYFIDEIDRKSAGPWPSETLLMIRLENDAQIFREMADYVAYVLHGLANQIDQTRTNLTSNEEN